jgi:serine/threonine protein kinase
MTPKDDPIDAQQSQAGSDSSPNRVSDPAAATVPGTQTSPDMPHQGLIGLTLHDRFFIESELGSGGVGVVYLARDRKLHDRQVVVKVLLEKSVRNERIVQKFQQEMEALARVSHPGIVGIYDVGELPDGKPFIVMEYVDGVNLRSAMPPEGMAFERAANIIKQIGSALAAAHEKGILHRDLKPENIMLKQLGGGDERVAIIDFGVAKIKNSLVALSTVTPTTLGTYGYMSPEQFRGEQVTPASDVYSLGVIFYEMLTGRRPFNPETVGQLGELQREGVRIKPKDLRPALPESAQNVILRALSFAATDRYQNARDFGDLLSKALKGGLSQQETLLERPPQSTQAPAKTEPRFSFSLNTAWLKVAISFVFVAVVGVAMIGLFPLASRRAPAENANTVAHVPLPRNTSNVNATANVGNIPGPSTLRYWLTIRTADDKPYKSLGKEIIENGNSYEVNAINSAPGYFYVIEENSGWKLVYPKTTERLKDTRRLHTPPQAFPAEYGVTRIWIVWSRSPIAVLDGATKEALSSQGTINAQTINSIRQFLSAGQKQKPEENAARKEMTLVGDDPLVTSLELQHRSSSRH